MINLPFWHSLDFNKLTYYDFIEFSFLSGIICSAILVLLTYLITKKSKEMAIEKAGILYPNEQLLITLAFKFEYVLILSAVAGASFAFFILPFYIFANFSQYSILTMLYCSVGFIVLILLLFYRACLIYILTDKGIRLIIPYDFLNNKDSRFCPYEKIKQAIYSTWPEWVMLELKDGSYYEDLKGSNDLKKALEIINLQIAKNKKEGID